MTHQEHIEFILLNIMVEHSPESPFGYFFTFNFFMQHTQLDREIIRGFMRSMRNRQLVEYGQGFDDYGHTIGSGYSLTPQGASYRKTLREQLPDYLQERQQHPCNGAHRRVDIAV